MRIFEHEMRFRLPLDSLDARMTQDFSRIRSTNSCRMRFFKGIIGKNIETIARFEMGLQPIPLWVIRLTLMISVYGVPTSWSEFTP